MNKRYLILLSIVLLFCVSCSHVVNQPSNNEPSNNEPSNNEQSSIVHHSANTQQHSTHTVIAHTHSLTPKAIQACKNKGGEIKKAGLSQMPHCVIAYPDAGKPCKNTAQCEGRCLLIEQVAPQGTPVVGECQHNNLEFGCYAEVEGGVAGLTLCID